MSKDTLVAVRLIQEEVAVLDKHTKGQLSRAAILRLLVQDFLEKSEKEQREFLVKRLFGK